MTAGIKIAAIFLCKKTACQPKGGCDKIKTNFFIYLYSCGRKEAPVAKSCLFRGGKSPYPRTTHHHGPVAHGAPGDPAHQSGTSVPRGGDFPHVFLFVFPHQRGPDYRNPVCPAAKAARLGPAAHGRPQALLAGRGAGVFGSLLLWGKERGWR